MEPSPISIAVRQLNDWEAQFAPWFEHVHLVGEIPLTTPDVEKIGQGLRTAGAVRVRKPCWPHTLIVYMAAVAARNDERSYWPTLLDGLGLPNQPNIQNELGELFRRTLRRYKLPEFEQVGGYRFVTPIRLHGGIPVYSLPDFFEEVVWPAVTKPEYTGTTTEELIALALKRSVVHYFVDSPVRYFLEHGGEPAETFFARCLEMARNWQAEGALPSAPELELPRYVVHAFRAFMEGRLRTARGQRLRAPFLHLAPSFGDALFTLELPEQPVDVEQAGWAYLWRIHALAGTDGVQSAIDEEVAERVRVRRSGYDLITVGRSESLFLPPCQLRIQFEATPPGAEPQVLGRWRLDLDPTLERPFAAFRPGDGRPLSADQALPADVLWLFYPRRLRLKAGGEARRLQSFPELAGDWADWQIEEWDLRRARTLWLVDEDGNRTGRPLAVRQAQAEARLLGEDCISGRAESDGTPLYLGRPPALWVPRLTGATAAEEMADWRITLASRWATAPRLDPPIEQQLSHWHTVVTVDGEGFTLPLSALLGEEALGVFTLTVRGPRNFRQEIRLRLWSPFVIDGLEPYYLPGAHGARDVDFDILVAETHHVAAPAGETATKVRQTETDGLFRITGAADATEARLELIAPCAGGYSIRLPLRLAVPRLRWLLRLDDSGIEWKTMPDELPVAKFLQSRTRSLILDWSGVESLPHVGMALLDATQEPPVILQEEVLKPFVGSDRRNVVDLSRFHDTAQFHHELPILTLALQMHCETTYSIVPLVQLKRTLEINAAVLAWDEWGKTALHWDSPHRLRNRRVRIWSAWRPWEPAQEFVVPDDAPPSPVADGPGGGMMTLPERLPKGWYHVAFRTAHHWEETPVPAFPTDDAVLSRDGDWELRAVELNEVLDSAETDHFPVLFELACIHNAVDESEDRDAMVTALRDRLSQGQPRQIVALKQWLQCCDRYTAKAVRVQMYRPDLLERLFGNDFDAEIRIAYLADYTNNRLIGSEAAQLVLEHTVEPEWVAHSLVVLIERDLPTAIDYLVKQMDCGAFSDGDALDLLSQRAEEAFNILHLRPRTPARDRLMLQLADKIPDCELVRRGHWVRCEAGWGRIDRIVGSPIDDSCFFADELPEKLCVTLRADGYGNGEPAEIDLAARRIEFIDATTTYRCTKDECRGFVSADQHLVVETHNRAAHQGLGPAFTQLFTPIPYWKPLHFARQAPADPFS